MKKIISLCAIFFCSSSLALAAGSIFEVTAAAPDLIIQPKVAFSYTRVGIKLTAPGFTINNIGQTCQMANNGYCLFAASQQSPKTLTISGTGQLTYILCSNGDAALNCQNYSTTFNSSVDSLTKAYVGRNGEDTSLCTINLEDGTLDNCVDAGDNSPSDVYSLAFNTLGTRVYIAGDSSSNITKCDVDAGSGFLSNCQAFSQGFSAIEFVALNSANTRIYATDYDEGGVWVCDINASTGALENCILSGADINGAPEGIALNSDSSRAYIVVDDDNKVVVCDINANDGLLTNCSTTTEGTFNAPFGIALTNNNTRAYVTNTGGVSQVVTVCDVNANNNGALENCVLAGAGFSDPLGIALDDSKSRAYVTNEGDNSVSICDINDNTGLFNSCTSSGISSPQGITLQ